VHIRWSKIDVVPNRFLRFEKKKVGLFKVLFKFRAEGCDVRMCPLLCFDCRILALLGRQIPDVCFFENDD
jgi:hypothetical protein